MGSSATAAGITPRMWAKTKCIARSVSAAARCWKNWQPEPRLDVDIDEANFRAYRPLSAGAARRPARSMDEAAGSGSHRDVYPHPDHSRILPAHPYRKYGRGVQPVCRLSIALEDSAADRVFVYRDADRVGSVVETETRADDYRARALPHPGRRRGKSLGPRGQRTGGRLSAFLCEAVSVAGL